MELRSLKIFDFETPMHRLRRSRAPHDEIRSTIGVVSVELPPYPELRLRVLSQDERPDPTSGFVRLERRMVSVVDANGKASEPFVYDVATRKQLDAVVIAAHCLKDGVRHVYLRSALRVPLALRTNVGLDANLWELPAGLIEEGETPENTVIREIAEELGFAITEKDLRPLGPMTIPVPGLIAERQFSFAVEVDPAARGIPAEEGALEQGAAIALVPLDSALALARAGKLPDAKTELALRRLAEMNFEHRPA